jgi:uncharacterized membrane protein
MKKGIFLHVLAIVIALVPLIYLAIAWPTIPGQVPVHFNSKMEPDRIGSKNELAVVTAIISFVSVLLFILLRNLHRFDPKRRNRPSSSFSRLGLGLVVFMSSLSILIILSATNGAKLMESLLFPIMGLLFAFLGNYMVNLKPNYFAGFRLPWTLSDNENWRKTHQLGGKIWFWAGLIFAITALFIPFKLVVPFFVVMMVVITLWPAVYSYRLFKEKSRAELGT